MMQPPLISVLMSVYNGERYLAEAVESILNQTFTDFEFIIINDGSTDGTAAILQTYDDPRIKLIEQSNIGLTRSLNKGIALACGKYIARMDADDVSMPERFAQQVAFLEAHPEIGVLGTGGLVRDEINGIEWDYPVVKSDTEWRRDLIKGNQFIHTSVMIRKSLLEMVGGYDESYTFAQDYDLWIRLAAHTQMANLPCQLVIHREHPRTVTKARQIGWHTIISSVWTLMKLRSRVFRSLNYPLHYILYVLQPILFTFIELNPNFVGCLKRLLRPKKQKQSVCES